MLAVATMAAVGLMTLASPLFAVTTVTSIAPFTPTPTPGEWYESDLTTGGTASIVDLTGLGGNLENNQPLPVGAALITTDFTNEAQAEVGVANSYGKPIDIFDTLNLIYSYHKAANAGQNDFAAPSIKLTIYNPVCDAPASGGDCFGKLVYEPYWQGPDCAVLAPTQDTWTTTPTIDKSNGCFWWTGGFGLPNGAGGPPLDTLETWLTNLSASSTDFAGADLVVVSVGVGSYNQGQIGYFDDVRISHAFGGGFNERYNFEPPPDVDHLQCYDIDWSTKLDRRTVNLEDQFAVRENVRVSRRAEKYCTPVNKNGEGITNPDNHLTCYRVKGFKPKRKVKVENQFGEQTFKLDESELLCVPSTQIEVTEVERRRHHHHHDE